MDVACRGGESWVGGDLTPRPPLHCHGEGVTLAQVGILGEGVALTELDFLKVFFDGLGGEGSGGVLACFGVESGLGGELFDNCLVVFVVPPSSVTEPADNGEAD